MKMKFTLLSLIVLMQIGAYCQNNNPKIKANEKKQVIDSVSAMLNRSYVFPETATKMTDLINSNYNSGAYNAAEDCMAFVEKLNEDLQSVSHDKHLAVRFGPMEIREMKEANKENKEIIELQKRREKMNNYGFKEVRILSGNVGYIRFDGFGGTEEAFQIASAAMNYLSNTDAIIFDMRQNGGGSPEMVQLIISYLYDNETVHLNSFFNREDNSTSQTWTLPFVQGKRNPNCKVYVLTSVSTFSAAEEFTYDLKNLKRATIVGATTGGGAHPVKFQEINDNFFITLPFARAINPITNTNWEGAGIEPDIKSSYERALDVAHIDALTKLTEKETNLEFKFTYQWTLEKLKANANPVVVPESVLKSYVGVYGPRIFTLENGSLYYEREGRPKYKLIPLTEDYFELEGYEPFRLRFIKEGTEVVAVEGNYDNGMKEMKKKTK